MQLKRKTSGDIYYFLKGSKKTLVSLIRKLIYSVSYFNYIV